MLQEESFFFWVNHFRLHRLPIDHPVIYIQAHFSVRRVYTKLFVFHVVCAVFACASYIVTSLERQNAALRVL